MSSPVIPHMRYLLTGRYAPADMDGSKDFFSAQIDLTGITTFYSFTGFIFYSNTRFLAFKMYFFREGKKIRLPTRFSFREGNCPFCLNVDPPLRTCRCTTTKTCATHLAMQS